MVDITADSTVYPSANDIAETEKEGRYATEQSHTELLQLWVENHVVSGFTVPSSDPDLTLQVGAGECVIDGRRVVVSAATDMTLTDAATNHIWVQLSFDGDGNVDGVDMVFNTTGTPVANAVKIAEAVAAAGAITGTKDFRRLAKPIVDEGVWGPSAALHLGDDDTASQAGIGASWTDIAEITLTSEDLKGVDHRILAMASGAFEYTGAAFANINFRFYDKTQAAVIGARANVNYRKSIAEGRQCFALQDSDVLDGTVDHTVTLQAQETGSGTLTVGQVALDVISTGKV